MEPLDDERFIRKVEGLIDPDDYSFLYVIQKLKKLLPRRVFRKLLRNTSRKTPLIGFVIEPYSLFLFFRIRDLDRAKSMLPDRYELVKTGLFDDDEPDYYLGYGTLNTRASTFMGVRLESYLIARDLETGLLSWIFIDILSITIIALTLEGVADPNSRKALFTTNARGEVFADIREDGTDRGLSLKGSIIRGRKRKLNEDLWLLGNTSIGHSRELMYKDDNPFAVIFDPAEVETALDIPVEDMDLRYDNLFPGLAGPEISRALCFPFAQHYLADSPGCRTVVRDKVDMLEKYATLAGGKEIRTFSTRGIRKLMAAGALLFLSIAIVSILLRALMGTTG